MQTEVQLKHSRYGGFSVLLAATPASVTTETEARSLSALVPKLQSKVGSDLFDMRLSQMYFHQNGIQQQVVH